VLAFVLRDRLNLKADVTSNFLTVTLHLFPTRLPKHLQRLLSVYTSSFFSLPIKRADGTELSFEDVVRQLDEDTISYGIGIGSSISEDLQISFRIEKAKYDKAIAFARDLLFHSVFATERLIVTASKNVQSLPSEKREGNDVASSASRLLIDDEKKSLNAAMGLLFRSEHDVKLAQRLKDEPQAVVKELEELRAKRELLA
jgi:Zn-dependent M16 (insulinase) family peptidase